MVASIQPLVRGRFAAQSKGCAGEDSETKNLQQRYGFKAEDTFALRSVAVELVRSYQHADDHHRCREHEAGDSQPAVDGYLFRRYQQRLHEQQEHPRCVQRAVYVENGRAQRRVEQAGQVIGTSKPYKDRNQQYHDHAGEEDPVIAPARELDTRDRRCTEDVRHGRLWEK